MSWASRKILSECNKIVVYIGGIGFFRIGYGLRTMKEDVKLALPTMRPGITGREFVRVAGGFGAPALGSSPAGGLDIDNAGNLATDGDVTASSVGIGTSAGAEKLQIFTSADETIVAEVKCTSTGTSAVGVLKATGNGGSIQVMQHGTGRTTTRYGITVADYAEILANGSAGLLIGSQEAVKIVFGTNSANRMVIDAAGNIGINTATPGARVEIEVNEGTAYSAADSDGQRTKGATLSIRNPNSTTDSMAQIVFFNRTSTVGISRIVALKGAVSGHSQLAFVTDNGTPGERMRIDEAGNVTIASLAGSGLRTVVVDANGVLSAP